VAFAASVRTSEVRRAPGIAEVVDWARALAALEATSLDAETLRRSLGALIKNRDDLERVLRDAGRHR
jgi:hypothetical protein